MKARSGVSGLAERRVRAPGWMIRTPDTWCARVLSAGVPEPFKNWAETGRLLAFPAQDRQVLWPLIPTSGSPGWEPVPGIEPVIAAARQLRPEKINGFIEAGERRRAMLQAREEPTRRGDRSAPRC